MLKLGITLFLKLTLTISNINLTYFGVRPVTSNVNLTGEKYAKEYLPHKHAFDNTRQQNFCYFEVKMCFRVYLGR